MKLPCMCTVHQFTSVGKYENYVQIIQELCRGLQQYKNKDVSRHSSSVVKNVCLLHTPQWIKLSSLLTGGPMINKSVKCTTA